MRSRHLTLALAFVILVCGQGCFVYRYTVTPPVSGIVLDATTKRPVAGATVGFRKHERQLAMTASDGSFVSRPDHVWRPCFILPGELWPSGGHFFVEASGYKPYEQEIITTMGRPFTNAQPIQLVRETR